MSRRWKIWSIVAIGVLALVIGGPWVYIHVIQGDAPPPLALGPATASPSASSGADDSPVAGISAWTVTDDSVVGYRVQRSSSGRTRTPSGGPTR